jgi:Uri superfamily endonuclease
MLTRTRTHRGLSAVELSGLKGVYVLVIQLIEDAEFRVAALGKLRFGKGTYVYVGSAQNNLEKRIARHFRSEKRMFWHIDYLLQSPASRIVKVFWKAAGKTEECEIAKKIGTKGEAVTGFGCSDCCCKSHLFCVEAYGFLREFMEEFRALTLLASS